MTPVVVLSAAICVTMFALGFGLLIRTSGAVSGLGSQPEWWFLVCSSARSCPVPKGPSSILR